MTASVKWHNHSSELFNINQGVRQGGVLSTEHYKRYNNPLLVKLEHNYKGATIGNIHIPHTTCADDLALLSHSDIEISSMLKCVETFSTNHRYDINSKKSACLIYGPKPLSSNPDFILNNEQIPITNQTTHLGIIRETGKSTIVDNKINLGRRTAYSLLGAGFHGLNGLTQNVKAHIWNTYIIPRTLYGLEVTTLNQTEMKKLEAFQTKSLKQIQHLPDRTANVASMAAMGVPPIEVQIHKNILNLFFSILQTPQSIEYEIAVRQLATKGYDEASFFSKVRRLLLKYDLPSAYSLMQNTPVKSNWKKLLKDAVNNQVQDVWAQEIKEKSSLKYLNPDSVKVGKTHHIYRSVRSNKEDIKRSELKAKILFGSYTLQSNRCAFNQYTVDPTCKLCEKEQETREHFIGSCSALQHSRSKYKRLIFATLTEPTHILLDDPRLFTHLILDSTHPTITNIIEIPSHTLERLELLSREYLWKIHLKRSELLAKCQ